MTMREVLRTVLDDRVPLVPGVWDPLGGLLAQSAGAPVVYLSGFAFAASLGMADTGLTTMTQVVERARAITSVLSVPLIADADQGYGGTGNALLTLELMHGAGVAAVQVEDQRFPKQSGSSKDAFDLMPVRESARRIEVLAAQADRPLVIARTDALIPSGIEDCVERLSAYADAGADLLMTIGPKTEAEFTALAERFPRKWVLVLSEASAVSPIWPFEDYLAYQPAMVVYSTSLLWRFCGAGRGLAALVQEGHSAFDEDRMIARPAFDELIGTSRIVRRAGARRNP
jgi:methylisocitrate lyase